MSKWKTVKKKRKGGGKGNSRGNIGEFLQRAKEKKKAIERDIKDEHVKNPHQMKVLRTRDCLEHMRKLDLQMFTDSLKLVPNINYRLSFNLFKPYKAFKSLLYIAISEGHHEFAKVLLSHPHINVNVGMEQKKTKEYEEYYEREPARDSNLGCALRNDNYNYNFEVVKLILQHPTLQLKKSIRTVFYEGGCSGTWTIDYSYLLDLLTGEPSAFEKVFPLVKNRKDFDPNVGLSNPGFPGWACCGKNYSSPLDQLILGSYDEERLIKRMLPFLNHPKTDVNLGFDDIYRDREVPEKKEGNIFPLLGHAMENGFYKVVKILMMYGTDKSKLSEYHDQNTQFFNSYGTKRIEAPEDMKLYVQNYPYSFDIGNKELIRKFFSKRFKEFALFLLLCFQKGKYLKVSCSDIVFVVLSFVNETWFGKNGKYKINLV